MPHAMQWNPFQATVLPSPSPNKSPSPPSKSKAEFSIAANCVIPSWTSSRSKVRTAKLKDDGAENDGFVDAVDANLMESPLPILMPAPTPRPLSQVFRAYEERLKNLVTPDGAPLREPQELRAFKEWEAQTYVAATCQAVQRAQRSRHSGGATKQPHCLGMASAFHVWYDNCASSEWPAQREVRVNLLRPSCCIQQDFPWPRQGTTTHQVVQALRNVHERQERRRLEQLKETASQQKKRCPPQNSTSGNILQASVHVRTPAQRSLELTDLEAPEAEEAQGEETKSNIDESNAPEEDGDSPEAIPDLSAGSAVDNSSSEDD